MFHTDPELVCQHFLSVGDVQCLTAEREFERDQNISLRRHHQRGQEQRNDDQLFAAKNHKGGISKKLGLKYMSSAKCGIHGKISSNVSASQLKL
jgi:hypothetical protein